VDFDKRIQRVLNRLKKRGLDGLLISNMSNLRYVSGYSGDESLGLIGEAGLYLITDFRYIEQAQMDCRSFEVVERKKGLFETAGRLTKTLKMKQIAIEEAHLSHKNYLSLSNTSCANLSDSRNLVESLREIKDDDETEAIRNALAVSQKAFTRLIKTLRAGMSEKDIADEIEMMMKKAGAESAAFETIAAIGPKSSLPHAKPGSDRLRGNEVLLVDWGARRDFYNSDLTRTLFAGRIPPDFKKIYSVVLESQRLAIKAVRPGTRLCDIDKAARDFVSESGYGSNFGHGLGHGVGLDVHERPAVNARNRAKARPGMVFTVEPAVYIPGWGGIRIEDMVRVTEEGHEVLSHVPKTLRSLQL
jgi:Xaa-Pro aminopeptidase